jgi:NADP-dependent 3-hydroxy acid dehydrogenase YdfG
VRDFMEVLRMESATEGTNIRTTTIYPAAISTELLGSISHKDIAEGMAKVYERFGISPDRIATVAAFAIDQPEDTTINEFTVGPPTSHGKNADERAKPSRCAYSLKAVWHREFRPWRGGYRRA